MPSLEPAQITDFADSSDQSILSTLFSPTSIAIVGASATPEKIGHVLLKNLLDGGYAGKIYPVNPKAEEILGVRSFASLEKIGEQVEVVCIAVPAEIVPEIIEQAVHIQAKIAIIISAGFRETGDAGIQLEERVRETAKKGGLRILGPNCLGLLVPQTKLNLSFAPSQALPGKIAVLAQSGAVLTMLLDKANSEKVGFSHLVSCGNKLDLDERIFIEQWLGDPSVEVIGAYLEETLHGRALMQVLLNASTQKPIVLLKPGVSKEAQHAVSSHTGSMTGSNTVIETATSQLGVQLTHDLSTFFDLLRTSASTAQPKGNRVAIITNAGGPGIIATDHLILQKLKLAELTEESQTKLKEKLPDAASVQNPVDLIGDAPASRYQDSLNILLESPEVDLIMIVLTPQLVTEEEMTAEAIADAVGRSTKPVVTVFLGGDTVSPGIEILRTRGVLHFTDLDDAAFALSARVSQAEAATMQEQGRVAESHLKTISRAVDPLRSIEPKQTASILSSLETMQLAESAGLNLPEQKILSTLDEVKDFLAEHQKIVMKATNEILEHKTDKKGVFVGVDSEQAAEEAWDHLTTLNPNGEQPSILVQAFVESSAQVFLGVQRDGPHTVYEAGSPGFGHLFAMGKGGIYTEVYEDLAFCLAPFTREVAAQTLRKTKISKILDGTRGQEQLAVEKVIDTIMRLQDLILRHPEIVSLDLNPLLVSQSSAVAVDLKVYIQA